MDVPNIRFSDYCTGPTSERHFPESKHRSARIKKKLIKRYGSEFVMGPAIYDTPYGILAHTSFERELRRKIGYG